MKNRTRSPPFRPFWNASISRAPWSRSTPWDAIRPSPRRILDAKADYLLAVKDNQPTLHADIKSYFETAPSGEVERFETVGKDHGRLEIRTHTVSHVVDWYQLRALLSGRTPLPQTRHHRHGREPDRARRQDRDRAAILHLLARRSRPQPSPTPCEATGPSKTTSTGPST